jgi:hypothetical protein
MDKGQNFDLDNQIKYERNLREFLVPVVQLLTFT